MYCVCMCVHVRVRVFVCVRGGGVGGVCVCVCVVVVAVGGEGMLQGPVYFRWARTPVGYKLLNFLTQTVSRIRKYYHDKYYEVATISRLLKIISLFCRMSSVL